MVWDYRMSKEAVESSWQADSIHEQKFNRSIYILLGKKHSTKQLYWISLKFLLQFMCKGWTSCHRGVNRIFNGCGKIRGDRNVRLLRNVSFGNSWTGYRQHCGINPLSCPRRIATFGVTRCTPGVLQNRWSIVCNDCPHVYKSNKRRSQQETFVHMTNCHSNF